MRPILFKFGSVTFYSYGAMVALGFLAGILFTYYLAKKNKINPEKILDLSLFVLLGSIIGARLFYAIFFWYELKNPLEAFMVWNGGLIFYGGLLFGFLGVVLGCKRLKLPLVPILDIVAPGVALGYAIGRIGCFLNGCCHGIETNLPWGVYFPHLAGFLHPTQIYSSLAGLAIFAALLLVFNDRRFPGQIFSLGIILYGFYRFLVEFVRANPKIIFNMTEAQIASVFVFILGIALYGIFRKKSRSE